MADRDMPEEVFRFAVHDQFHDLPGQMLGNERGVFEMSLIDKFRDSETGDCFADTTRLVKRILILRTCRAKVLCQHSISNITLARALPSTSVLPPRG